MRADRTLPIVKLAGSRDPGTSPSIECPATEIAEKTDIQQSRSGDICRIVWFGTEPAERLAEFLEFSKLRGNNLSRSVPEIGFPGLQPGDRWCLCAPRWQEAFEANQPPRVILRATHEGALEYCSLADLKRLAVDLA